MVFDADGNKVKVGERQVAVGGAFVDTERQLQAQLAAGRVEKVGAQVNGALLRRKFL